MVLVLGTTHTPIIHTPIIISAFLNFTFSPTNIHFSSEIIKSTYIKPISVPCTTFYDSLHPPTSEPNRNSPFIRSSLFLHSTATYYVADYQGHLRCWFRSPPVFLLDLLTSSFFSSIHRNSALILLVVSSQRLHPALILLVLASGFHGNNLVGWVTWTLRLLCVVLT